MTTASLYVGEREGSDEAGHNPELVALEQAPVLVFGFSRKHQTRIVYNLCLNKKTNRRTLVCDKATRTQSATPWREPRQRQQH